MYKGMSLLISSWTQSSLLDKDMSSLQHAVTYGNAPDDSSGMVLTPGGFRQKGLVHHIPAGNTIDGSTGHVIEHDSAGKVVNDHGPVEERTGGLPLMPGNVVVPKDQRAPLGSGWITYADWTNNTGNPLSLYVATWYVPPAPTTNDGQTVFLFNGIQNSTMIYQPVLQWGPSAAGGGAYWAVASWYADGQGGIALHSGLTPVSPGQKLIGVMALTGQSGTLFSYQCQFIGIPNSILPITNVQQLTWLVITLEAYGITQKSDYPNVTDTTFTNIIVQTGYTPPNVTWTPVDAVTDTGQHTVVLSNAYGDGYVIIFYT
jgi:hypothetical protein